MDEPTIDKQFRSGARRQEWHDENNYYHRDGEKPALIVTAVAQFRFSRKEWWIHGKKHRLDGPAIEYEESARHKEWWVNGKRHRLDGPAVENGDHKEWWVNGRRTAADYTPLIGPREPTPRQPVTRPGRDEEPIYDEEWYNLNWSPIPGYRQWRPSPKEEDVDWAKEGF